MAADEERIRGPIALSELADLIRGGVLAEDGWVSIDGDTWHHPYCFPEVLESLPLDRDRLVREYVAYGVAPPGEENWGWASDRMFEILEGAPDIAWELVIEMVRLAPTQDALGFIASSPLEDLLSEHGPHVIDRVEVRAGKDPKFRRALRCVWRLQMTDEVWERVQTASKEPR